VLAGSYLAIYGLTYFAAIRLAKMNGADSSVLSLTLAFPNAAAIGIPLLPAVYGQTAAVSAVIAIAVGAVTISPLTLAILEHNTGDHEQAFSPFLRAIRRPVVWAPVLAVLLVAVNFNVPTYAERSLGLFATATAGAALFLTGLVLSAQRFRLNWSVGWSVVGKTLLQPALCLGAARAVGLTPEQTRHVVLITAIPCGFFGVVFGKSFNATAEVASSSLIASTLVGVVTLAAWIAFNAYS